MVADRARVDDSGRATQPSGTTSCIIVDYRAGAHLRSCLESLRGEPIDEIVVVDNSRDHSTRRLLGALPDKVRLVESATNGGFGAGVNLGLRHCNGSFVAVSNPDVVIRPGAIATLRHVLRTHSDVALAGPAIFDDAGGLHQSARAFPTLRRSSVRAFAGLVRPEGPHSARYVDDNRRRAEIGTVDWVSGAFFLARRDALESVGGFDESYFLYLEEVDLCWRLSRAGWSVRYEPSAEVTHVGGVSGRPHPYKMIVARHRSLGRFTAKTATGPARLALPVVELGVVARAAIALTLELARRHSNPPPASDG